MQRNTLFGILPLPFCLLPSAFQINVAEYVNWLRCSLFLSLSDSSSYAERTSLLPAIETAPVSRLDTLARAAESKDQSIVLGRLTGDVALLRNACEVKARIVHCMHMQ